MGITDNSILDLMQRVRSWIGDNLWPVSYVSGGGRAKCRECQSALKAAEHAHRCRSCGRTFCLNCMQAGAVLDRLGQPRFCRFCFPAAGPYQVDRQVSPEPQSPMFRFSHSKSVHLMDSNSQQQFASPLSPWSTCCRSDEEEDMYESGKHFFSPMSEISQDVSDMQEVYSFKSANSSPLYSPSRAGNGPSSGNVALSDQESLLCERRSDCFDDNLSVYGNQESEDSHQSLDFESNGLIWYPPPPEHEEDDVEDSFLGSDDEDDVLGDSGMSFAPSNFGDDDSALKEKLAEANKEQIRSSLQGHFRALVSQLLKAEGINPGGENGSGCWLDIVSTLAWQAASYVRPDTSKGGSMDPGAYVKVKCVSSGSPRDSTLVRGVVCTKNVKHKRMTSQHKSPRLLILGGALEFHRVQHKLSSIDTVLKQEIDDLKKAVGKIEAHRPNVLLVEKSVASHAQEYLLAKEISLVLNVKRPLLERISRCTGAQIVPSIDNLSTARLGQCEIFRVERVYEESVPTDNANKKSVKTLMFFEGCPRRLGCTVLLRGTCQEELKKVKHVVQYASFAAYHLALEMSFLADEGATLRKILPNSPLAFSGKLMHVDTSISKPSNSYIPNSSQRIPGGCRVAHAECSLHFPADAVAHEVLKNTEQSNLSDRRNLMVVHEERRADITDGNEVSTGCLSVSDPQSILVSLSSSCILEGTLCERSQLHRIKFYGSFDKPLGTFLRDNLFDQTSCCQSCKKPAEAHVQCYTHKQGTLTINVKRLPSVKLAGERDGRIWMWHRCLKCECRDGVPPAAHRVVMSDAALGLSFGKFLELSFSNNATANRIASCGHSLQKDCLRFYGYGSMVAFFRYSPVDILSVYLPPSVLDFTYQIQPEWVIREAAEISGRIEFLHTEVSDVLHAIEQKIAISKYEPLKSNICDLTTELKNLLKRERNHYDVLLQSANVDAIHISQPSIDILKLNHVRRCLLIDSYMWERRLYLLNSVSEGKAFTSKIFRGLLDGDKKFEECRAESFPKTGTYGSSSEETFKSLVTSRKSLLSKQNDDLRLPFQDCKSNNPVKSDLRIESVGGYVAQAGFSLVSDQCYGYDERQMDAQACNGTSQLESLLSPRYSLSDKLDLAWNGSGHFVVGPPSAESDADLLEHLIENPCLRKGILPSRVSSFDSVTHRNRTYGLHPALFHLSSVKPFDACQDFASTIWDPIPNIERAYYERSPKEMHHLNILISRKPVFLSSISQIVSKGARLLIPQTGLDDSTIAVYDNEPSSIICYAISSQEYAGFITSKSDQHDRLIHNEKVSAVGSPLGNNTAAMAQQSISQFQSDNIQSQSYGSDDPQALQGNIPLDLKDPHFSISFDDELSIPDDKVKFSVTCYFAKQFGILRKKCCPDELDFIRSLSRCKKWTAQGGKSSVYFAKSLDERFIIKQVTKTELDSFEEFGPAYFKYLMESINSGSPTCLAKVLGIYQVSTKYLKAGREVKMDLMVMENLFFGRNISRVYDLKGSSRARYNSDTTGNNKVLLDLNLLETLCTKPIFLGSKAKRSLERAVWNDTSFLASSNVMDYSLLVGIDEGRKELVIGIIDYLRNYTWGKQLETWVKSSGILGGPKNASPTVISPKQYKKRFRKAMSNYFLTVPDHWFS